MQIGDLHEWTTVHMLRLKVERLIPGGSFFSLTYNSASGMISLGMRGPYSENNDHKTLVSLGITDGSTIMYMLRLGGAPDGPYWQQWVREIKVNETIICDRPGPDRTVTAAGLVHPSQLS